MVKIKLILKMENKLNISIYSFLTKGGIPEDNSGNGGGFVFDCRGILNPWKNRRIQTTNRRKNLTKFLETKPEIYFIKIN